jgi:hypothetical protein
MKSDRPALRAPRDPRPARARPVAGCRESNLLADVGAFGKMYAHRAGDHLKVSRGLYAHHAIYVGEDRVVQFGGRILDKPEARIQEVLLREFQRSGEVSVVDHSRRLKMFWLIPVPPVLPPERIVARAKCLASHNEAGAYNVLGRNCETIALWCVCGAVDSFQRERFQLLSSAILAIWFSFLVRHVRTTKRISVRQALEFAALWAIRSFLVSSYTTHSRRFIRASRSCEDA